jgi:hypothetical protein
MRLKPFFAGLTAVAVLIAICTVLSPASAHVGHVHAVALVASSPAPAEVSRDAAVIPDAKAQKAVEVYSAVAAALNDMNASHICDGACCSLLAGMSCCSGALIPRAFDPPPPISFSPLVFADTRTASGLPPETLPRPPKSFA